MIVKTVSFTYGRKVQTGAQYESAHVEITLWADIEEGDDLDRCMHALHETAKQNVMAKLAPMIGKTPEAKAQEYYLGLPSEYTPTGE